MIERVVKRLNFHDWDPRVKTASIVSLCVLVPAILVSFIWAGTRNADLKPYIESVKVSEQGMTLWQILQSGGLVMMILGVLSMVTVAIIVYFYLNYSIEKMVPLDFSHDVIRKIKDKRGVQVENLCEENDNIVSSIVLAVLNQKESDVETKEVVEQSAKREVSSMWSTISYLADIAQVAPMLGLLGTVIGMIQAFNTIAFQSAVVKPMLLAGGVSKAMVTTAAGMSIAIVAMVFYSVFRTRAQSITDRVEILSQEIVDAFNFSRRR